jgi:hypothetical protein
MLTYPLAGQLSAWGDVRISTSSVGFSDAARDRIDATRASLQSAWTSIVAGASGAQVDTSAVIQNGGGHLSIGGGVEYCFMGQQFGGWHPSVRGGIGVVVPTGADPTAQVDTRYRFSVGGSPFDETDRVIVSLARGTTFGAQFGGALRRPWSDRLELVVEVMFVAQANGLETLVTSQPSHTTIPGGGAVAFVQTPSIQFSNSALPSSLGQPLDTFNSFTGSGLRLSTRIAAGISFGF